MSVAMRTLERNYYSKGAHMLGAVIKLLLLPIKILFFLTR